MIIGVEHIGVALSGGGSLQWLGYAERFRERDLPNAIVKGPFLRAYEPLHAIQYYEAPDTSPAIEAIDHGTIRPRPSDPFPTIVVDRPLPQAAPAAPDLGDALRGALGYMGEPTVGPLPGSDLHVVSAPGAGARVAAYVVAVRDVGSSASFWADGLGLLVSSVDTAERWACLRLSPPVPRWCMTVVLFAARTERVPRYMDEEAVTNIALLSSDVESDRERLAQQEGTEVGTPFRIRVHERDLNVCIARTRDGDLIELIHIARARVER